jgi:hypothetical protein
MVKTSRVARSASTSPKSARAAAVVVVVAAVAAVASAVAVAAAAVVTAAAIGVVVAEGGSAELVASVTAEVTGDSQPLAANSNARAARAASHPAAVSPPAVTAEGTAESRPVASVPSELVSLANEIGQAWSQTYVRLLQEQERDIVGAWPGTIREARRQVLARIKTKLEPEQLDQLARITNLAARRGWETVSEPDLES